MTLAIHRSLLEKRQRRDGDHLKRGKGEVANPYRCIIPLTVSRDSDLRVTCRRGCHEVVKIDGYDSSDMSEAIRLGIVASDLCRGRWRAQRWPTIAVAMFLFLSFIPAYFIKAAQLNTPAPYHDALVRAHAHYVNLDYSKAKAEIMSVLESDPYNGDALYSLRTVTESAEGSWGRE